MGSRFSQKHQRKVNECYPRGTGETGAAAGKISALTYYINAKPVKLLKVSAYLERKVPKDLARESPQFNGVTLEIVEGIMHGCSDYFATFAPTVLTIITAYSEAMLTTELALRVHKLFIEFCRMTKTVLPSIRDSRFFDLLTQALAQILGRSIAGQRIPEEVGRAVQAAVAMEDFRAPLGDKRIGIIINTVVSELRGQENTQINVEDLLQNRARHADLGQMLGSALLSLVEGSNSTTVPMIMESLFSEFDKDGWSHPRLTSSLLSVMAQVVPAQCICVLVSETFKRLETADDAATAILATSVAELLRSNRSPLGYSALELAGNLLKLLRKQRTSLTDTNEVETHASFVYLRVPPPRTIFAICNAFASLLRNANFAMQKYEIIECIIARSFFPGTFASQNAKAALPIPVEIGRHSLGTVTLDSNEEGHFRSVVWGILFALAEEATPPSVLRLAFVEVHVRLFELLFRMLRAGEGEFCLNTLVFWQQLLTHGLPIVPTRRATNESPSNTVPSVLGRPSNYILTKTRYTLAKLLIDDAELLTIIHISALFALLRSIVVQCDLSHLAHYLRFIGWVHERCLALRQLTFEDRACVSLFTNYLVRDIGRCLAGTKLLEIAEAALKQMSDVGMVMIEMEEVLDRSHVGQGLCGAREFRPEEMVPRASILYLEFANSVGDSKSAAGFPKGPEFFVPPEYNIGIDEDALAGLVPSGDKPPSSTISQQRQPRSNRNTMGTFSRLSQLGSTAGGVDTAPAFYGVSSAAGSLGRTLTVSSSSLAHSDAQSLASTAPAVDVLEGQFDELSLRMKGEKQKKSKSMLFFKDKD